jgi:hypothetical protein
LICFLILVAGRDPLLPRRAATAKPGHQLLRGGRRRLLFHLVLGAIVAAGIAADGSPIVVFIITRPTATTAGTLGTPALAIITTVLALPVRAAAGAPVVPWFWGRLGRPGRWGKALVSGPWRARCGGRRGTLPDGRSRGSGFTGLTRLTHTEAYAPAFEIDFGHANTHDGANLDHVFNALNVATGAQL